jgi:hypothetical protein
MTQPNWITPAGSLGTFPSNRFLSLSLVAVPMAPAKTVTLEYLGGILPIGIKEDPIKFQNNTISGTPQNVLEPTDYSFVIRATDNLGNIKDRTFTINIYGTQNIGFKTRPGLLLSTNDSTYIDYQLNINNTFNQKFFINVSSGTLPPGLTLSEQGRITGYAQPPVLGNRSPIEKTFSFTLALTSIYGVDTKTYSILVRNHILNNPPNTRKPAILNNAPITTLEVSDPNYAYYFKDTSEPKIIINANEFFSFKIIGYDFENQSLNYSFSKLPQGLVGDTNTGWISGTPISPGPSYNVFQITVNAFKASNPAIRSDDFVFTIVVQNLVENDLTWVTPENLGFMFNGEISELSVLANASRNVEYRIIDGSLPPNMQLLTDGEIVGRVPFQSKSFLLPAGTVTPYTFTVEAYLPQFPLIRQSRTFTLNVVQSIDKPVESLYFKALPKLESRTKLNSLINNSEIFPRNFLYRPEDKYFSKTEGISFNFAYGIESTNFQKYYESSLRNFYKRRLLIGDIKTAVARDKDNKIIYEVVYAEIIDDLINRQGKSISEEIVWPTIVKLENNENFTATNELFTSLTTKNVASSQQSTTQFNPASTTNMRNEIINKLPTNRDQKLLPKWMTSQQKDGSTLGFIQAWVICYTLPEKSEIIRNNIINFWGQSLNDIDFTIDRFFVDKSITYNYNTTLALPAWTNLPGGTPEPTITNENDIQVLFPKKTILPDSST